jgi:hypothetical protein
LELSDVFNALHAPLGRQPAVSLEAMRALHDDDRATFLELRGKQIDAATVRLVDRHAEWKHSDRPSISALSAEDD